MLCKHLKAFSDLAVPVFENPGDNGASVVNPYFSGDTTDILKNGLEGCVAKLLFCVTSFFSPFFALNSRM